MQVQSAMATDVSARQVVQLPMEIWSRLPYAKAGEPWLSHSPGQSADSDRLRAAAYDQYSRRAHRTLSALELVATFLALYALRNDPLAAVPSRRNLRHVHYYYAKI